MPWAQSGATRFHAQLRLPDKVRAIKGLVVCYSETYEIYHNNKQTTN